MASGDGAIADRTTIHARVPGELKYLVICYQNRSRLVSFNMAMQRLLETHPALAQLAAELYTEARTGELASGTIMVPKS